MVALQSPVTRNSESWGVYSLWYAWREGSDHRYPSSECWEVLPMKNPEWRAQITKSWRWGSWLPHTLLSIFSLAPSAMLGEQDWGAGWVQESSNYELREDLLRSSNKGLNLEFSFFFSLAFAGIKDTHFHAWLSVLFFNRSAIIMGVWHENLVSHRGNLNPLPELNWWTFLYSACVGHWLIFINISIYILLEVGLTFCLAVSLVHTEIAKSQKPGYIQPHEGQPGQGAHLCFAWSLIPLFWTCLAFWLPHR